MSHLRARNGESGDAEELWELELFFDWEDTEDLRWWEDLDDVADEDPLILEFWNYYFSISVQQPIVSSSITPVR